jgi:hypothetical protein
MPTVNTAPTFYLEANSLPLSTPGWRITNLPSVLRGPDVRGTDRVIPLVAGQRPYLRRTDKTVISLEIMIFGDRDHTNAAYTNSIQGAITNLQYLRAQIFDPTGTGDGTRLFTLHLPPTGASTLTAYCHTGPLVADMVHPGIYRATADLSIPAGKFA